MNNYVTTVFGEVHWNIREPILTRYLDQQYVNDFFKDGTLRLSSFEAFRKHEDEERGDVHEGRATQQIQTPNGMHTIVGFNDKPAYILSACAIQNPDMEARFFTGSGIRIDNPLRFAECVAKQIPGFSGGFQGLCTYQQDTMLRKRDANPIGPPDDERSLHEWASNNDAWVGQQCVDSLFLKRIKYSHQYEYRFIWLSDSPQAEYLRIECPEAHDVCHIYRSPRQEAYS